MCNLYSITKGQQAICDLTGAMRDSAGNMPPLPGAFPDYSASVVPIGSGEIKSAHRHIAQLRLKRPGARWPGFAFPSVPALGSAGSATGRPALFVGFTATMAECDFSRPFIAGYGSSPSRHGPARR
jgi:hypothetical protein